MNRMVRLPVMAALLCAALTLTTGCNKLKARDQLGKGVQSFKGANYEAAVDHFQQAVQLDPSYPLARLYLATAYSEQVVPHMQTPDNLKNAHLAIQSFEYVLQNDPKNTNALKGIAALYLNIDDFANAKAYQNKVLAIDPSDAAADYTIGVIDWTLAFKNAIPVRQSFGLQDNGDPIKDKKACAALAEKNGPVIQEGLDSLEKAVQLKENYDDAMSYLALLYRRKADIECGDDDARKADLATSQSWVTKGLAARKENELKRNEAAEKGAVH